MPSKFNNLFGSSFPVNKQNLRREFHDLNKSIAEQFSKFGTISINGNTDPPEIHSNPTADLFTNTTISIFNLLLWIYEWKNNQN